MGATYYQSPRRYSKNRFNFEKEVTGNTQNGLKGTDHHLYPGPQRERRRGGTTHETKLDGSRRKTEQHPGTSREKGPRQEGKGRDGKGQ